MRPTFFTTYASLSIAYLRTTLYCLLTRPKHPTHLTLYHDYRLMQSDMQLCSRICSHAVGYAVMQSDRQFCTSCKQYKLLDQFKTNRLGAPYKTCLTCCV